MFGWFLMESFYLSCLNLPLLIDITDLIIKIFLVCVYRYVYMLQPGSNNLSTGQMIIINPFNTLGLGYELHLMSPITTWE